MIQQLGEKYERLLLKLLLFCKQIALAVRVFFVSIYTKVRKIGFFINFALFLCQVFCIEASLGIGLTGRDPKSPEETQAMINEWNKRALQEKKEYYKKRAIRYCKLEILKRQ